MRLLLAVCLFLPGCTAEQIKPDRLTVGVTVENDSHEIKSFNGALTWDLH